MKKNKPQISAKAQYFKKKKEMPSGVDDLATHQEQEMNQQQPVQQQVVDQFSSEEEIELGNGQDVEEQSRFLLGLIQKNKLSEKNSFEVPFIDLRNLKAFHQTEQQESWKEISAYLDASSRVYGFRVDFVHHNTFKILAALNRAKKNDKEDDMQEEQENKNKRIQNSDGANTLEKNSSNIETNKFDLENEIDPLFQQTSALFDEGSSRGLLLRNLRVNDNLLLSFETEMAPEQKLVSEFDTTKYPEIINEILNYKLCPELVEVKEAVLGKKNIFTQTNNYEEVEQENYLEFQDNIQDDLSVAQVNFNTQTEFVSKSKYLEQSFVQPRTQHFFNVCSFEQTGIRLGTGRLFENEKEQAQFLQPNLRLQPKRQVILTKAQDKPRSKKRQGLAYSFDIIEENELDRETILQPKDKEDYCYQRDPLIQLSLLPKSYLIDQQHFDSPYQIPSFPRWDEIQENQDPDQQNDLAQEDMPYGALSQIYATRSKLVADHMRSNINGTLNIPIRVLKAKIWEAIGPKIPFTNEKKGIDFDYIVRNLPYILKMDPSRGKVSDETIFVTMLHLANEQGLTFKQKRDGIGFIIQKEQHNTK